MENESTYSINYLMKNIILFDPDQRDQLLPFTYTRPVCEIRIGIDTIREKWERALNGRASYITQDYLCEKYPIHISADNFIINGAVMPNKIICDLIEKLNNNEALLKDGDLVAARVDSQQFYHLMTDNDINELIGFDLEDKTFHEIRHVWDIFQLNNVVLREDFTQLTEGRTSQPLSDTNTIIGDISLIFLEAGAIVEGSILNTKTGPIYIGKNAEIMEGCIVRGPLALCEHSILKMGAKIYGATTIGPYSKFGGEVNNCVVFGYSNKAHDGFVGNSVIGEWCNLGADSNTSNLKNTYDDIKLWDYTAKGFRKTGLQFLGLMFGDHSKCGINTMFNTGTVVGVCASVFGAGYPRNFIPSFAWGGAGGFLTYDFKKACDTIERVMQRREQPFTKIDKDIMEYIFEFSHQFRTWEKEKDGLQILSKNTD